MITQVDVPIGFESAQQIYDLHNFRLFNFIRSSINSLSGVLYADVIYTYWKRLI